MDIRVIHEDEWIVVLDKPPGLVVTKAESVKELTLEDYLQENFGLGNVERCGIVHRLDKDTSGVLVVAKNNAIKEILQKAFAEREVNKHYLALVHGELSPPTGVVELAIMRNPQNREKFAISPLGRYAKSEYRVQARFQLDLDKALESRQKLTKKEKAYYLNHALKYCLVDVYPFTGRTHQIRVHLQHLGAPLVSDKVYLNKKLVRLDVTWCPRHFLHALEVRFIHPATHDPVMFCAELSPDLKLALSYLNKCDF
jgi:23S rRNA pseudouridine1911/1915/1917 synthase